MNNMTIVLLSMLITMIAAFAVVASLYTRLRSENKRKEDCWWSEEKSDWSYENATKDEQYIYEAPLDGEVWRCGVEEGEFVKKKQEIMVYGELKVCFSLLAPKKGKIHFFVKPHDLVKKGEPLFAIVYTGERGRKGEIYE